VPAAEFVFIQPGQKPLPDGAEPFDMPGVRLSHRRGHCTFHTMLREYTLTDPVLRRIARIVDEADVVQEVAVEPVAPGPTCSAAVCAPSARTTGWPWSAAPCSTTRSMPNSPVTSLHRAWSKERSLESRG
jgi:hypothetical protein